MGSASQPEQTPAGESLNPSFHAASPAQASRSAMDFRESSIADEVTQIPFPPDAFTAPASYIQHSPEHTPQTPAIPALPPSDPYSPITAATIQQTPSVPPPPPLSSLYVTPFAPERGAYANPYAYAPVSILPLPLDEAIQQLPRQYIRVLVRPSVSTFQAEMGKAAWNITWFQIILYALFASVFAAVQYSVNPMLSVSPQLTSLTSSTISSLQIIVLPLSIFMSIGLLYLIARMVGGRGTFLQQCYTTCLYTVPLGVLDSFLLLIPITGILLILIVAIYVLVLSFRMLKAVHHLSSGKAILVLVLSYLLPLIILVALTILFVFLILGFTMAGK